MGVAQPNVQLMAIGDAERIQHAHMLYEYLRITKDESPPVIMNQRLNKTIVRVNTDKHTGIGIALSHISPLNNLFTFLTKETTTTLSNPKEKKQVGHDKCCDNSIEACLLFSILGNQTFQLSSRLLGRLAHFPYIVMSTL